MIIYDLARRAKHKIRDYKRSRDCEYVTTVRRIEKVFPIKGERICAMTFDDGPTNVETNPKVSEDGLTLHLLKTLEKYGARGTFDVIGTTAENYPDVEGEHGSFSWGGVRYDHYPDIKRDDCAGALARPELVTRIIEGGHEISNHGYRHILFGHLKLVYGARACFENIHEVVEDMMKLHDKLLLDHNYEIRLARPPHYVDKIPDGKSSYDAYRYAGYNYMAASFDGGGWLPSCGDTKKDVEIMVEPIRKALEENPDSLNGQIIFQKDGYNMSRQTPVAEALPLQLELLTKHGYKVVTVSELLSKSSFEDCRNDDANLLANAGYAIAYRNNTLQPERKLTFGELVAMTASPDEVLARYRKFVDSDYKTLDGDSVAKRYGIKTSHPYYVAFCLAAEKGLIDKENKAGISYRTAVTGKVFADYMRALAPEYDFTISSGALCRGDVFSHIRRALL